MQLKSGTHNIHPPAEAVAMGFTQDQVSWSQVAIIRDSYEQTQSSMLWGSPLTYIMVGWFPDASDAEVTLWLGTSALGGLILVKRRRLVFIFFLSLFHT